MAAPTAAAGSLEGMEARPDAGPQPAITRRPAWQSPRVGQHQQGTLADRRLLDPLHDPDPGLLGTPRPSGIPRSLPPFPGRDANRRMRTRMSGGVGGAGVSPAPTRFSRQTKRTSSLNRSSRSAGMSPL